MARFRRNARLTRIVLPTTARWHQPISSFSEAAAIQAVGRSEFSAVNAVAGRAKDVIFDGMPFHDLPSEETMVWFITLAHGTGMGAQGAFVVVNYLDGTVYGYQYWIS